MCAYNSAEEATLMTPVSTFLASLVAAALQQRAALRMSYGKFVRIHPFEVPACM